MAEGSQYSIEDPDFDYIKQEAGPHTRDGIFTLWLAANAEAEARRTGVRQSIERVNPKKIILSPSVNENDVDTDFATVLEFDGAASVDITGFQARPDPTMIVLAVLGAGTITLKNNNAGSLDRNKILTATAGDLAIATNTMTVLWYLNSRWRQLAWA